MDVVASVPRVHLHAYPRLRARRGNVHALAYTLTILPPPPPPPPGQRSPARWYKSRVIAIPPCQSRGCMRHPARGGPSSPPPLPLHPLPEETSAVPRVPAVRDAVLRCYSIPDGRTDGRSSSSAAIIADNYVKDV